MAVKVIDVNVGVFDENDRIADEVRAYNKSRGTRMINIIASPGAGKTTTLLRTIDALKDEYKIGVMEADIEASVDAEKMIEAGVSSIQVHTGGECAMDASMVQQALKEFDTDGIDLLFMENVGNLVCTAEQDTGADYNVEILSVPEGDDKPLKYPFFSFTLMTKQLKSAFTGLTLTRKSSSSRARPVKASISGSTGCAEYNPSETGLPAPDHLHLCLLQARGCVRLCSARTSCPRQ